MNIKRAGGRIRGKIGSYSHVLSKRGDKTFASDIHSSPRIEAHKVHYLGAWYVIVRESVKDFFF